VHAGIAKPLSDTSVDENRNKEASERAIVATLSYFARGRLIKRRTLSMVVKALE
jgi:hypothetical protein